MAVSACFPARLCPPEARPGSFKLCVMVIAISGENSNPGLQSPVEQLPRSSVPELRVGALLIVFAHTCDLLSTWWRTPDLEHEISPGYLLLESLGLSGWPWMIALKVFAVLLTFALFAFYVRRRRGFYPAEPGRSFHEFLHDVHGVRALRRRDGQWVAPSPLLLAIWMSFTVSIGTAAYAYFLAIHNVLGTSLMSWMAETVAPFAIFVVTAVVFWRTLYHDYLHTS